jgi:putative ABC transport system ATP-binding protein
MIELKKITRAYQMGDQVIRALDEVSLTISDGEYVAIIGPSGSGKSTLMNVLGCLDNPTSGQYLLNGKDVSRLRDDQLADVRNKNIGFVFQRFNLMGRISAVRNVEMPARYGGANSKVRRQRALEALTAVSLGDRVNHKPVELSGGQQQRVAIARALVNQPNILLADEPTGALDSKTGKDILDLFERLHRERGITLIVVTHDPAVARRADRVISIRDGRIESDIGATHAGMNGHAVHATVPEDEVAVPAAVIAGVGIAVAEKVASSGNGQAPEEVAALTARDASLSRPANESTPAPSSSSDAPAAKPAQRLSGRQLLKRGLIAVVIAVAVNVALGLLIGAALPITGRLPMFSPLPIALFTAVFGLIGTGVFALVNRFARKPIPVFRWIAVGALLLSFVPNVLAISNPAVLRQITAFGGGARGAQGGFPGGQFGNGQGSQQAGQGAQGGQGGQGGQQGNRGNRGVPGLGPLGGVFGGNNAQGTRARGGGAGLLAIPMAALMLLHVVAFGIIAGVLTRRTGGSASPQLSTSGLT